MMKNRPASPIDQRDEDAMRTERNGGRNEGTARVGTRRETRRPPRKHSKYSGQVGKLASRRQFIFFSYPSRPARLSASRSACRPGLSVSFSRSVHRLVLFPCLVASFLFRCGLCDSLTGRLHAMSELVKTARASRCLPLPARFVVRVSLTPLDDGVWHVAIWR